MAGNNQGHKCQNHNPDVLALFAPMPALHLTAHRLIL
jgi:hypothetical protein